MPSSTRRKPATPSASAGRRWNRFGAVAGAKKATAPNPKLIAALGPTLAAIKDEMAALNFAFVLEGEIPEDLHGVYVRNGPNPQHEPVGRYHWFDGDGMLHAVHFAEGRATYRNRWVRTDGFEREREADGLDARRLLERRPHDAGQRRQRAAKLVGRPAGDAQLRLEAVLEQERLRDDARLLDVDRRDRLRRRVQVRRRT